MDQNYLVRDFIYTFPSVYLGQLSRAEKCKKEDDDKVAEQEDHEKKRENDTDVIRLVEVVPEADHAHWYRPADQYFEKCDMYKGQRALPDLHFWESIAKLIALAGTDRQNEGKNYFERR